MNTSQAQQEKRLIASESQAEFASLSAPQDGQLGRIFAQVGQKRLELIKDIQTYVDTAGDLRGNELLDAARIIEQMSQQLNFVLRRIGPDQQGIEGSEFTIRTDTKKRPPHKAVAVSLNGAKTQVLTRLPPMIVVATDALNAVQQQLPVVAPIDEIRQWLPNQFFKWFSKAIQNEPRKDLIPITKAWIVAQQGKHGFEELDPVRAVEEKGQLGKQVMKVVDELGLKIVCGKQFCGRVARLHGYKVGTSKRGTYIFCHIGSLPGIWVQHAMSSTFPRVSFS